MKLSYGKTKIACFGGYTVQAIINNFLPILFIVFREKYGLSYESLGRIIFINFAVQIFADVSTPIVVKKIGYKKAAVLCHALATFGLVSFLFMGSIVNNTYWSIVASVVIYAFGSGIIEVVISPIIEFLPTDNKAGNMAVLHSFYCWGQAFTIIVTTVLIKILGYSLWKFVPVILAIVPFVNMFLFCFVPVVEPDNEKEIKKTKAETKQLFLILVIMLCSGASEISMSQWTSVFAQNGLGVSKFTGDLLGPCAFAVFMGTGRILYAVFSDKIKFTNVLIVCSILCMLSYFIVGVCDIPAISLVFCAFCGITVSAFWPGTLSYSVKLFKGAGAFLFGAIALFGDIGCSLGPWIFGIVADKNGLNSGFIVSLVFPFLMLVCAIILAKENIEKSKEML